MQTDNGSLRYGIELDYSRLQADAAQAESILNGIGQTAVSNGSRIDDMMKTVGKGVAAYFSAEALMRFGKEIINVRKEIESLEVSFNTMTGSAEAGGKLLSQIREFAVSTPMQMNDLAKGAQTLLSFNTAAEDVMPILKSLGDISMGDAQKFNALTLAFSQMSSTGKLMGQDLLQMINAGFNPLAVIAEKTGKSIGELKEEMSKGAISAEMVKEAFFSATSEGGKFYGMLEAQSKTLAGSISNLQGAVQDMFNSLGEASEGVIGRAVEGLTTLVKNYEKVGFALMEIVGAYGAYKAALIATNAVQKVQQTASHMAEIESLRELLTAEQSEMLSKSNLQVTDEEYYATVKKLVAANIEEAKAALATARTEVSASTAVLSAKRSEYAVAKEIVVARQQELAAAVASGDAKAVEAAQTALNTAEQEKQSAAVAVQTAMLDKNTKQLAVENAAKNLNTATNAANTAAQNANAASTNLLAVAKTKLISVMNKLKAAIMSNPYAAAAAAILALVMAVYKLATAESEAQKSHKEFVRSLEEGAAAVDSESIKIDRLFEKLKKAKEGTDEWRKAREKIIEQYGSYIEKLGLEVSTTEQLAEAHMKVKNAILEEARAKQMDNAMSKAADDAAKVQGEVFKEIKDALKKDSKVLNWEDFFNEIKRQLTEYMNTGEERFLTAAVRNWRKAGMDPEYNRYKSLEDGSTAKMMYEHSPYNVAKLKNFKEGKWQSGTSGFESFDKYIESVRLYNKDLQIAEDMFGEIQKKTEETAADEVKSLKELQSEYDKLLESEKGVSNETYKEIKVREKQLEGYKEIKDEIEWLQKIMATNDNEVVSDVTKRIASLQKKKDAIEGKNEAKTEKEERKRDDALAKWQEDEEAYNREIEFRKREAMLSQQQLDAELLEEGTEKTIELNRIAREKRLLEIDKLEQQYIGDLMARKKEAWKVANPDKSEQEWLNERPELSAADLEEWQRTYITFLRSNAISQYNAGIKKAKDEEQKTLKESLDKYRTYEQKRNDIIRQFEKERKSLYEEDGETLKDGVTEGNIKELERQREEALAALDQAYASIDKEYLKKVEEISRLRREDIESAKTELQDMKDVLMEMDENSQDAAVLRALIKKLEEKIRELEEISEEDSSDDKMRGYTDAVMKLADAFGVLDDEVGSAFANMVQSVLSSRSAFEAAVNFMIGAINVFKTAILSSQHAYEEGLQKTADTYDRYMQDHRYKNFDEFYKDFLGFDPKGSTARYNFEVLFDVKSIGYSATKLKGFVSSLMGSLRDFAASSGNMLGQFDIGPFIENATNKLEAMNKKLAELEKHPKRNKDEIEDYIQAIEDESYEFVQLMTDTFDNVLGGVNSMTGKLADAIITAFDNGTDAAKAWGDSVEDIIRNIARNVLIAQFIEKPLTEFLNMYMGSDLFSMDENGRLQRAGWFDGNGNIMWDRVVASLPNISDYINSLGDGAAEAWESLVNSLGIGSVDGREGTARGIAQASQESVDELNGRMTAVQGHTYSISENTKLLVSNTSAILQSVLAIEANTGRLSAIEGELGTIRSHVDYIRTHSATIS